MDGSREYVEGRGLGEWEHEESVGQDGLRMQRESNEKDNLIEGTITGLGRSLVPRKLPEIHKDDSS